MLSLFPLNFVFVRNFLEVNCPWGIFLGEGDMPIRYCSVKPPEPSKATSAPHVELSLLARFATICSSFGPVKWSRARFLGIYLFILECDQYE